MARSQATAAWPINGRMLSADHVTPCLAKTDRFISVWGMALRRTARSRQGRQQTWCIGFVRVAFVHIAMVVFSRGDMEPILRLPRHPKPRAGVRALPPKFAHSLKRAALEIYVAGW